MADLNPLQLWRRLLAAPNEARGKTLAMAVLVSGISALAVSTAAVFLGPLAEANRAAEREARLAAMMDQLPGLADILAASGADTMDAIVVNLATDAAADEIDPDDLDERDEDEPAGDLALLADLGVAEEVMEELLDDVDLYPDEVLSDLARLMGFGELFDDVVGLTSA